MNKILIIDNYDSFTYNLVQLVDENFKGTFEVKRNDAFNPEELNGYDGFILSPGPGIPDEAGLLKMVIRKYASSKKILGVCLGMQAIAEVFGGQLLNLDKVYHGVKSNITSIDADNPIFKNIPKTFEAGRYHSWIVDSKTLPDSLIISCIDEINNMMALRHKTLDVYGVQFHPESVLTEHGEQMIINFLNL